MENVARINWWDFFIETLKVELKADWEPGLKLSCFKQMKWAQTRRVGCISSSRWQLLYLHCFKTINFLFKSFYMLLGLFLLLPLNKVKAVVRIKALWPLCEGSRTYQRSDHTYVLFLGFLQCVSSQEFQFSFFLSDYFFVFQLSEKQR